MLLLPVVVSVALAAAPPPPAMKLASTGFSSVNLDEKTTDFFAEYFAQQLQTRGIKVTTKNAVAAVVGLERQKALLGCTAEANSCLAELAGALGVDGLVLGSIARFSGEFVVNLKIVSAKNGDTVVSEGGRLDSDRKLLDWFTQIAERWAPALRKGTAPPSAATPQVSSTRPAPEPVPPAATALSPAPTEPERGPNVPAWILTGTGGALLLTSAVTFGISSSIEAQLRNGSAELTTAALATAARTSGEQWQNVSRATLAAGALSAGIGGIWLLLSGGPPPASASVMPVSGGAVVAISGVIP